MTFVDADAEQWLSTHARLQPAGDGSHRVASHRGIFLSHLYAYRQVLRNAEAPGVFVCF